MNDASVKFRLRDSDLAWQNIRGELVAIDMRSEVYLNGNRTAIVVWEMLEPGATRAELAQRLVAEFDIEPDRALSDVDGFLAELQVAGLLAE
jgi:hypothetical protein